MSHVGLSHIIEIMSSTISGPIRSSKSGVVDYRRLGASRVPCIPLIIPEHGPAIDGGCLLRDLPDALASGAIYLAYQPKLNLRTGGIESVEALIRWDHPRFGNIPPSLLISSAESAGEMNGLTLWVIQRAIDEQRLLARGGRQLTVYVNISAILLTDHGFMREICERASEAAGQIGLEVTETSVIAEPKMGIANLKRLVDLGFVISIDDYGTGLSSLVYLQDLPASELKIDKQFISDMTKNHRGPLIVRSTIDLAHALGMKVVAEGIESPATLALLRVMGCDYGQGFHISSPLTLATLVDFLDHHDDRTLLEGTASTLQPPEAFWAHAERERPVESRRLARAR